MVMDEYSERYKKARKKVDEIKGFYTHLRVYLVINILLLVLRTKIIEYISGGNAETDPHVFEWIDVNAFITPVLWGIGLVFHGLYVYRHKFPFLKQWEEQQIQKFMEEENGSRDKYE